MTETFKPAQPWTGRSDPEDGADARRMHHLIAQDAPRALLGFACDAGVSRNKGRKGARDAPHAVRRALANLAAPPGAPNISDLGDVVVEGDNLEDGQRVLADHVSMALTAHDRVVVLGGGHETAFGSFSGLHNRFPDARAAIINFDAHLDLRMPGASGPSSGTPFYQISQLVPEAFHYLCLGVAEESNTSALFDRADDLGVSYVTDKALIHDPAIGASAIKKHIEHADVIYLTIDIDVLPHYQAPGVSAPAVRGVPFRTVEQLVEDVFEFAASRKTPVPVADIVEVSPPHDIDGATARTAAFLLRRMLCA